MCEKGAAGKCSQCRFRREIGEALCCAKGPPELNPETGEARWPRVRPTDYCGAFAETPDPQHEIDNQSRRDAASAPNHQSSIIHYP